MITSESIATIAPALVAAQAAMSFAAKDAVNGHLKNKYADLSSVIEAVKPALNAQGIFFTQTGSPSDDGKLHMTTRLLHSSGEWIQDTLVMPLQKADPQGYGSAMTYARRYALAAITGLYQDDDDGQKAAYKRSQSNAKLNLTTTNAPDLIKRLANHEITMAEVEEEYALTDDQRQRLQNPVD